jgi:hypothetical protein
MAPFTVNESPLRAVTTPFTTSPFAHGTLLPASTVDAVSVRFDTVLFATTGVPCASVATAVSRRRRPTTRRSLRRVWSSW